MCQTDGFFFSVKISGAKHMEKKCNSHSLYTYTCPYRIHIYIHISKLPHHNTLLKTKMPLLLLVAKVISAGVNTVLLVDSDRGSFIRTSGPLVRSPSLSWGPSSCPLSPHHWTEMQLPAAELARSMRIPVWESSVNTWSPKRNRKKKISVLSWIPEPTHSNTNRWVGEQESKCRDPTPPMFPGSLFWSFLPAPLPPIPASEVALLLESGDPASFISQSFSVTIFETTKAIL